MCRLKKRIENDKPVLKYPPGMSTASALSGHYDTYSCYSKPKVNIACVSITYL